MLGGTGTASSLTSTSMTGHAAFNLDQIRIYWICCSLDLSGTVIEKPVFSKTVVEGSQKRECHTLLFISNSNNLPIT